MENNRSINRCPFCSEDLASLQKWQDNSRQVCCPYCGARGPLVHDSENAERDAVMMWNAVTNPWHLTDEMSNQYCKKLADNVYRLTEIRRMRDENGIKKYYVAAADIDLGKCSEEEINKAILLYHDSIEEFYREETDEESRSRYIVTSLFEMEEFERSEMDECDTYEKALEVQISYMTNPDYD